MPDNIKIIPSQPNIGLNDEVQHEGIDYRLERLFTNGSEVNGSGYKVLMQSERGLFGLKEII